MRRVGAVVAAVLAASVAMAGEPAKPEPAKQAPAKQEPAKETERASAKDSICGEVRITPELAKKVPEKAVLFVFAKPKAGPGAPAAVLRQNELSFPAKFCLSAKNAMAPGIQFEGTQFVTARVDADGGAMGAPGDLEGVTKEPVAVGTQDLVLTIDSVRK